MAASLALAHGIIDMMLTRKEIDQIMTNAQSALAWRVRMKLTRKDLARLSGYSASMIQDYEQGRRRGKPEADGAISDAAWLRYALALAAIEADAPLPFG